jgi:hypothetical protein
VSRAVSAAAFLLPIIYMITNTLSKINSFVTLSENQRWYKFYLQFCVVKNFNNPAKQEAGFSSSTKTD